jgi:hypothetical protein
VDATAVGFGEAPGLVPPKEKSGTINCCWRAFNSGDGGSCVMDAFDRCGSNGNDTGCGCGEGLVFILEESVLEKVLLMRLSRRAAR